MLVLDLGCGKGSPPRRSRVEDIDSVVGIDISEDALRTAKQRYPRRKFLRSRAELLPFGDSTFSRVVSSVAVPYTDIPQTVAEMKRVLKPGGTIFLSLHDVRFTLREMRMALPRPGATLFRVYVLANGLIFHLTGKLFRFPNGNCESFQTEGAIRRALEKAGFADITVSRPEDKLIVEAVSSTDG